MTARTRTWFPWLGLGIASSPAIGNLARQLVLDPPHRYVLLALLLTGLLLTDEDRAPGASTGFGRAGGWSLLILGFVAQLVGVASASAFIANLGIPTALLGVGLILGRPRPETLILTFGLVPIPGFLLVMGSPGVESWLAERLASILGLLSGSVEAGGPLLTDRGRRFELFAVDAGYLTAVCAAEWGWYRAARAACPLPEIARRALTTALLGWLAQPVILVLCAATLTIGIPDLGRFLLSFGVPITLGLVAVGQRLREHRR